MLGYSIAKKWKWHCQHHQKKTHDFLRKTKNYLKNPKWPWEITSQFFKGRERRKAAEHVGIFCQNLAIKAYALENYSNFKSKFLFNNESICFN